MKVIGLCGGSGSGKGVVAEIFSSHNIPIIDADAIYHGLTSSPGQCLDELREEFGEEIIRNNALYRPALAKIVFASENAAERRSRLNEITHKFVMNRERTMLYASIFQNFRYFREFSICSCSSSKARSSPSRASISLEI